MAARPRCFSPHPQRLGKGGAGGYAPSPNAFSASGGVDTPDSVLPPGRAEGDFETPPWLLDPGSLRPSSLTPAPPALPLPPFAAEGDGATSLLRAIGGRPEPASPGPGGTCWWGDMAPARPSASLAPGSRRATAQPTGWETWRAAPSPWLAAALHRRVMDALEMESVTSPRSGPIGAAPAKRRPGLLASASSRA